MELGRRNLGKRGWNLRGRWSVWERFWEFRVQVTVQHSCTLNSQNLSHTLHLPLKFHPSSYSTTLLYPKFPEPFPHTPPSSQVPSFLLQYNTLVLLIPRTFPIHSTFLSSSILPLTVQHSCTLNSQNLSHTLHLPLKFHPSSYSTTLLYSKFPEPFPHTPPSSQVPSFLLQYNTLVL